MWFWGDGPLLPVRCVTLSLHFSTNGSSLQVPAGLSCCEPSQGLDRRSPGPCGEPAVVLVCLAVSELGSWWVPWVRSLLFQPEELTFSLQMGV